MNNITSRIFKNNDIIYPNIDSFKNFFNASSSSDSSVLPESSLSLDSKNIENKTNKLKPVSTIKLEYSSSC